MDENKQPRSVALERYCVACGESLPPGHDTCYDCGEDNTGKAILEDPNAIFVAVQGTNRIMRGSEYIGTARTKNFARRIANALNAQERNKKGR